MHDAAIAIYANEGWRGFTFEAVARASGVGKDALYRRWQGRADLLGSTLEARWSAIGCADTGSLRGDLLMLTDFMLGLLIDTHAGAAINLQIDARTHPEVRALAAPIQSGLLDKFRALVERALPRGELQEGTSIRLLADVVVGAIANHVLSTPHDLEARMNASRRDFSVKLVNLIMQGVAVR
ncbi:MAG: TetR/AcrR family transcriptional regulator [Janthinobacterium lividum]